MLKKTLLGCLVLLVAFLGFVATRPAEFRVERSLAIAAPAMALFDQCNDHRKFAAWNPFRKLDPNVKNTFSGPATGIGSVCSWDGNGDIGAGSSTITESKPGELVRQRMDWVRPMEGTSTVEFTFRPQGDQTVVTWAMFGTNDFFGKLVSVFLDCETMCGPPFEEGLAELAKVVTTAPAAK